MSITFHAFEPQTPLAGPPPSERGEEGVSIGALTGGGLIGVVERSRGLRSLWRGRECLLSDGIELAVGDSLLRGDRLRFGPGNWERRLPVSTGIILVERGLAPDIGGGLVLQWRLIDSGVGADDRPPEPLDLRIKHGEGSGDAESFTLSVSPGAAATLLILPDSQSAPRVRPLLAALRARELQRANRSRLTDPTTFRILVDGVVDSSLKQALSALDDSLIAKGGDDQTGSPFLGGVGEGAPLFLEGTHLAEVGVAALLTGRRSLARNALYALAEEMGSPTLPLFHLALPLLHLAGQWALWTGDPGVLQPIRPALDRAVLSLDRTPSSAALPQPSRVLREIMDGIEPLGDEGWNHFLRDHLARIESPPSPSRRRALPVLGAKISAEDADTDADHNPPEDTGSKQAPALPAPSTFAAPDHPGVLARRTVQGARILRSWIEGVLGARPDAGYGRFRVAPVVQSEWKSFEARGLSAGDALISLLFRREEDGCEFTLEQAGGRVPVNLIFEPLLPFDRVSAVSIDGEPAEVELKGEAGGIRLRCQLPLDGERRIRVEGVTSGISSLPF